MDLDFELLHKIDDETSFNVLFNISENLIKEYEFYEQSGEFISEAAAAGNGAPPTAQPKIGILSKIKLFIKKIWNAIVGWFKKMKNRIASKIRKHKSNKLKKAIIEIEQVRDKGAPSSTEIDTSNNVQQQDVVDEYAVYYQEDGGSAPPKKKPSENPVFKEIFEACENKSKKFHTRLNMVEFKTHLTQLCGIYVQIQKEFINASNNFQLTAKSNSLNSLLHVMKKNYESFYRNAFYRRTTNNDHSYDKTTDHFKEKKVTLKTNIDAYMKGDVVTLHEFADYYDNVMEECDNACKRLTASETLINQAKSKYDIIVDDLIGNDKYSVASRFGEDVISKSANESIEHIKNIFTITLNCISYANRIIHDVENELDIEVSSIEQIAKDAKVNKKLKKASDEEAAREAAEEAKKAEKKKQWIYLNKDYNSNTIYDNFKDMLDSMKKLANDIKFSNGNQSIDILVDGLYCIKNYSYINMMDSRFPSVPQTDYLRSIQAIPNITSNLAIKNFEKQDSAHPRNKNKKIYTPNPDYIGDKLPKDGACIIMTIKKGAEKKTIVAGLNFDIISAKTVTDGPASYKIFNDQLFAKCMINVTDKSVGIISSGKFKGKIAFDDMRTNKIKRNPVIKWPYKNGGKP